MKPQTLKRNNAIIRQFQRLDKYRKRSKIYQAIANQYGMNWETVKIIILSSGKVQKHEYKRKAENG